MNQTAGSVALAIALAAATGVPVKASVPLPTIQQAASIPTLAPVLKKVMPAVVGISTRSRAPDGNAQPRKAARDAKPAPAASIPATSTPATTQARAAGSGVIVDARQGLIVTNQHVIDRAEEITVKLSDGRELVGALIGADPDTDIAVIKVAAEDLTAIPAGNSDGVEVGDFVLAIGNPFQIGRTVTSGIVSGLNRNNVGLEEVEDFIQTDAAIYPGHSGGALTNLRGELIGISTAFVGAGNANSGMGFAIPINMARLVIDRILETGDVRRGRLGITFEDATPPQMRELKLASTQAPPVVITKVDPGSPADLAGVKTGDVVTALGGAPVRDTPQLRTRLGLLWVGDVAELTVVRNGKPAVVRATIADAPSRARAQR